jgi:hypothetical protein
MAILTTGNTYVDNDQVTAATLNAAINSATFAAGAVDGATTQLSWIRSRLLFETEEFPRLS